MFRVDFDGKTVHAAVSFAGLAISDLINIISYNVCSETLTGQVELLESLHGSDRADSILIQEGAERGKKAVRQAREMRIAGRVTRRVKSLASVGILRLLGHVRDVTEKRLGKCSGWDRETQGCKIR